MTVNQRHPSYIEMSYNRTLCRDSYGGERDIKQRGSVYLPYTSSHIEDGAENNPKSAGGMAYQAYKMRAVYHEIFADAVESAIGVMHKHKPAIQLPGGMQSMIDNCTLLGEPMDMLLRRINTEQMITGRVGVLADIRKSRDSFRPVIALYNDEHVINWDDITVDDEDLDLRFVVLDESRQELQENYTWKYQKSYRVLGLSDGAPGLSRSGNYGVSVADEGVNLAGVNLESPSFFGNTINKIPFVFINPCDLSPEPGKPPLLGLANLCLAIYRLEADYRQNLFMQGQDTLVCIGKIGADDDVTRTGAGAKIDVPQGGDAKYIGVSSQGLPEQRQAIENDFARARLKGAQLIETSSKQAESGDALRIRASAQTATLHQIAMTGAAGLEKVLKMQAEWLGEKPDDVIVEPNLKFDDTEFNARSLLELQQSKSMGLKISDQSINDWMRDRGLTKRSLDEEIDLIESEAP